MAYRVLIVDDTNFMRKMAHDCLKQHGYEVAGEAVNGREAVRLYDELRPDIVLMDLTMPEMNGVDAMKEILRMNRDAVVLICSASNQQDMIFEALDSGAKGYIMKPFDPERLYETICTYAEPHLLTAAAAAAEVREQLQPEQQSEALAVAQTEASSDGQADAGGIEHAGAPAAEQVEEGGNELVLAAALADALADMQAEAGMDKRVGSLEGIREETAAAAHVAVLTVPPEETFTDSSELDGEAFAGISAEWTLGDAVLTEVTGEAAGIAVAEAGHKSDSGTEVGYDAGGETRPFPTARETSGAPASRDQMLKVTGLRTFTSRHICSWQENIEGERADYTVTYTSNDDQILIELAGPNLERQTIPFPLDGFRLLNSWLEEHARSRA